MATTKRVPKAQRPRGVGGKTSASTMRRQDEVARALRLKRQGMTLRDISRILECSLGKAHGLVEEGLKSIPDEDRALLVKDIVEREYALIRAHMRTRRSKDSAKVIQASHKTLIALFGLEAPTESKVTIDGVIETTAHDDVVGALTALLAKGEVGGGDPPPDPGAGN